MKKLLLTTSEFKNSQNEVKKIRANVGRVHSYEDGGEAVVLSAAMCAVIGSMGQAALNKGEDSIWISIFKDDLNGGHQQAQQGIAQQQPAPQMSQPQYQHQGQQNYQAPQTNNTNY